MARVKMYYVVEQLSSQVRRALADAVKEVLPGATVDDHELFRAFKRAINRKCNQWERVPDSYVDAE